jgi:glycerol kinase
VCVCVCVCVRRPIPLPQDYPVAAVKSIGITNQRETTVQ